MRTTWRVQAHFPLCWALMVQRDLNWHVSQVWDMDALIRHGCVCIRTEGLRYCGCEQTRFSYMPCAQRVSRGAVRQPILIIPFQQSAGLAG